MISRMTMGRPQQRYDHRLRELVQRTGDLIIATDLGVPRSTPGCGSAPRRPWWSAGSGGPDRAGTPTRAPHTPTTRPETRGTAPARSGPAAHLRLHVGRRATARWSRQAADPACDRSGPRMHPVAGPPAAPPAIAESVPRVATAAHRVYTGAHGRGGGPEDHASMPTFAASFGA